MAIQRPWASYERHSLPVLGARLPEAYPTCTSKVRKPTRKEGLGYVGRRRTPDAGA